MNIMADLDSWSTCSTRIGILGNTTLNLETLSMKLRQESAVICTKTIEKGDLAFDYVAETNKFLRMAFLLAHMETLCHWQWLHIYRHP